MSFLRNSNRFSTQKSIAPRVALGALVFVSALFLGLYSSDVRSFFGSASQSAFLPVRSIGSYAERTVALMYASLAGTQALLEENRNLREELASVEAIRLERELLREDNRSLRESVGRSSSESLARAIVIASPDRSPYDTLIIDAGADQGLKLNDLVFSFNTVIGRLAAVYGDTALVKLLSSPGEELEVRIGPSRLPAKALGRGGGNFEVTLPRAVDVKEGDAVVIPSLGSRPFGVVERVGLGSSDAFQRILFKNPFNLYEVSTVDVVREP